MLDTSVAYLSQLLSLYELQYATHTGAEQKESAWKIYLKNYGNNTEKRKTGLHLLCAAKLLIHDLSEADLQFADIKKEAVSVL